MESIIYSIKNQPEQWTVDKYYFENKKQGVSIWIANGILFCSLESGGSFNLSQKIKVWFAYRWWIDNAPINCLGRRCE